MSGPTGTPSPEDPSAAAGDAEVVRAAFDAVPTTMAVLEGPEHRVVAANRAWRELARRPFLMRPVREVVPDVAGQRIFELLDRVYETDEPMNASEWRLQMEVEGTTVEFYMDFALTPWRRPDGSVRGILVTASDVTDRVRERETSRRRATAAERRYEEARDVVLELQSALLPRGLPVLPGAARYLVAARDQSAGGDWFSAIPVPDGRLALVVGDIVGHGMLASSTMGQVRVVLEELLRETGDHELALRWIDRMAGRHPAMQAATVSVVVLDPHSGELRYGLCGHPPPLIASARGTRYLERTGGGPLGTGSGVGTGTDTLATDETLLLYSDGIIERPGRPQAECLDALAQVASNAVSNRVLPVGAPESVCERVARLAVELLTREGFDDDVTVLAAHRRELPVPPLHLQKAADDAGFRALLTAARAWLRALGPGERDQDVVELAVSELVANSVEHAYPAGQPGPVRLTLELGADGVLLVEVCDDGYWEAVPAVPPATTGRGLWLIGTVLDELSIDRRGTRAEPGVPVDGTTVRARHQLHHPANLGSGGRHGSPSEPVGLSCTLEDGPPRVLRLSGVLDAVSAQEFTDRISGASRGGVHQVVIDLTGLQVLASAGVRALFTHQHALDVHGNELRLVADPGGVAAEVLDLVGLEHDADRPCTGTGT